MSKSLLTDKLVETVKIRAMIPDSGEIAGNNDGGFPDSEIIDILNEEMDVSILPKVLDFHEEYYVYYEDIEYDSDITNYRIPYRAIGNKLREVHFVDSSDKVSKLTKIELEDLPDFQDGFTFGQSNVFYIKNDFLVIPNSSNNASVSYVRMYFYLRPNELVPDDEGGVITAINTSTGVITLSAFPTAFSTATTFDFISKYSPHKIYSYDIKVGDFNSSSKTLTFSIAKTFTTVNTSTEEITLSAHGYYTGLLGTLSTAGTLPTGFSTATDYYVIKVDDDTFKLATSLANAEAGTAIDITGAGSGTHTFTPSEDHIPNELIVGDYVCIAEESIVPQLPSELHSYLAQCAAMVCIEAVGDERQVGIMQKKVDKIEKNMMKLIDNRVEGSPQKINPRNGILKSSRMRRF